MKATEKIIINPTRLQWCCEAIDVDIEQFADDIKIAKTTLEKAEISIKQLEKIAKYFNRGLLFFLEPSNVVEDKIYSLQFRTINNQKPIHDRKIRALIENVEKQRQIYLGLMEDLEEPIKHDWLPRFALNNRNIKQVSANVRQWLNLPDGYKFRKKYNEIADKIALQRV